MARRFAPIPHDAYDGLDVEDGYAVLDLYMRAHNMRWRPMKATERKLAKRWGVSGRRVWVILTTLADLDLLTFEKGRGRKPTIITVIDPTKADEGLQQSRQQEGQQSRQQEGQQNGAGSKGISDDPESLVAALVEAHGEALVEALHRRLRPETELEPRLEKEPEAEVSPSATAEQDLFGSGGLVQGDPPPASPAPVKPAVLSETETPPALPALKAAAGKKHSKRLSALRIFERWRCHHPRAGEVPDDAHRDRIVECLDRRAKVIKGKRASYEPADFEIAEQDLADLVVWFHTAPGASHWQGHNDRGRKYLGLSVIFNPKKLGDRITDLDEWRDDGRSTEAAPSTAKGRGANKHVFGAPPRERDWIEAEVIESNSTPQGGHHGR